MPISFQIQAFFKSTHGYNAYFFTAMEVAITKFY